ncbi:oxalyl-CoA decarboxylase [Duncaniella freteri]|uniref:oxalyl-CoA decarboxylase n=5 Tax=Duncaniella TaxID=2518495 RepID=UPI001371CD7F|nr:oxalyl-CoA decarboxylase [Duncaniella freteri]NBJ06668.1 oxalyl-CoA decarboxylase [Alistipes sp. Z76]NCE68761.1 oxalyl-CoA decarboxylase [Muribaculaceae bacterium M3]
MTTNSQPTNTPHYPEQVTGMYILARALKNVGIETVYGLVGIPITEAAYMIQGQGIRFVGFRHEQQAGMAAATDGFLTKKPGVLMTVSSLGFMNGLTATANATVNCYPMIQISGASDPAMVDMNMGTYEQLDQFNTAKPVVKAAFRCSKAEDIPSAIARAYRAAVSGRPGGVYIDMTTPALGQVMNREDAEKLLYQPVDIYSPVAPNQESVDRAVKLLASAKRPAILLGKGAAYAQIDDKIKTLIEKHNIPYLPMSMAKGLMPDAGPLSALSCRSTIMQKADVIMIIGARLNWMLSFGKGKWNPDMKFIQLDVEPQEMDVNVPIAAPVVGDMGLALDAILAKLSVASMSTDPAWLSALQAETKEKNAKFQARLAANKGTMPMDHWTAIGIIKPILESNPDIILVNEGANTLDDTRVAIDMSLPRHRIDCATWAIMGMGMGSVVGAAVASGKQVVAIEGDSAFGFSGMDFSTICRFNLPVTVVILNNGGIYNGIGVPMDKTSDPAPTTLDINARYDKLGEAFGAQTYYVQTPEELKKALTESIASKKPCLIDVQLAADSGKESGHIGYLNPAPLQNITV